MTSAVRRNKHPRRRAGGFTLLEIVLVLLAIAVLGGGAVTMMILSSDERKLDAATGEVELLAKRARTIAGLQQRPYALEFSGNKVTLMPLAEAILEPEQREAAAAALEAGTQMEGNRFNSAHASWTADEETQIFVRRWASDTFIPINGKSRQVWRFDPEGFCEPLTVRYQVGKSWAETEFNPLTAAIRDLSKEVY